MFSVKNMIVAAALLLALPGCLFAPNEKTSAKYFDLPSPTAGMEQKIFRLGVFSNDTPFSTHLNYRKEGNRIISDPYNCWVQAPAQLLERYYSLQYPLAGNTSDSEIIDVRCAVTAFEFDLIRSEAVLAFELVLRQHDIREYTTVLVREKFAERTVESMTDAMGKAVEKAGKKLFESAGLFSKAHK